jgi:hypothetical protein
LKLVLSQEKEIDLPEELTRQFFKLFEKHFLTHFHLEVYNILFKTSKEDWKFFGTDPLQKRTSIKSFTIKPITLFNTKGFADSNIILKALSFRPLYLNGEISKESKNLYRFAGKNLRYLKVNLEPWKHFTESKYKNDEFSMGVYSPLDTFKIIYP